MERKGQGEGVLAHSREVRVDFPAHALPQECVFQDAANRGKQWVGSQIEEDSKQHEERKK